MLSEDFSSMIYFDLTKLCLSDANPKIGSTLVAKIFVNKKLIKFIDSLCARTACSNEEFSVKMKPVLSRGRFAAYIAKIPINEKITRLRFKIYSKDNIYWYNARGVFGYNPNDYFDFKIIADNASPAWVNKSVFYEIFPDRFHHGFSDGEYADFKGVENEFKRLYGDRERYFKDIPAKLRKWGEAPDRKSLGYEFYFGTLGGIAKKVDYLNDLGVNAIYLTPILKSPSNHRYDTADYFEVDPLLGGNNGFEKFMKEMKKNKIKVILDAVYNHSGFCCDIFKKAKNGEEPFADFFNFYGRGKKHYACWLGNGNLPKLDYSSEKLCDYIFATKKSASARWLLKPYEIDGYRLDVAHMIGKNASAEDNDEILSRMKKAFKRYKKDAFIFGENFFDSRDMVVSDSVDSVMNYHGFTFPVMAYLSGKDHKGAANLIGEDNFSAWLLDAYAKLPQASANIMYNLLSSHDVSRHNSLMGDDFNRLIIAAAFLFTYPGVPSIYYGDEIGLSGVGDPGCRACMIWDEKKQDRDLKSAYKRLIEIRKSSDPLAYGSLKFLRSSGGVISYFRKFMKETVLLISNISAESVEVNFTSEEFFSEAVNPFVEVIFDSRDYERSKKARGKTVKNSVEMADGHIKCILWADSAMIVRIKG